MRLVHLLPLASLQTRPIAWVVSVAFPNNLLLVWKYIKVQTHSLLIVPPMGVFALKLRIDFNQ